MEPEYEEIYQNMVKLMDVNTKNGDKTEQILSIVELVTLLIIVAIIVLAILLHAGSAEYLHRTL